MSQVLNMNWRQTAELRRPTNYTRNLYHAANGLFVSWLVLHVLSQEGMVMVAGGCVLFAWTAETTRRIWPGINNVLMTVWGKTAHPHERTEVNSGSWIVSAMLILALFLDNTEAVIGVIVCGFGDPAAAVIGRRFGKTHIANGRTLEGSLAFVGVAFAMTLLMLTLYKPELHLWQGAVIALAAAAAGAAAELWAPIDDNFSIPIAASLAGVLTMLALGLTPAAGWLLTL